MMAKKSKKKSVKKKSAPKKRKAPVRAKAAVAAPAAQMAQDQPIVASQEPIVAEPVPTESVQPLPVQPVSAPAKKKTNWVLLVSLILIAALVIVMLWYKTM
jgi:hypothetical protein